MTFALERVVPWGRARDEYVRMFALSEADLSRRILGCGDGPASFNAESPTSKVLSLDPIYAFTPCEIELRVQQTRDTILEGVHQNMADFVWDAARSLVSSPADLEARRIGAMHRFLDDWPRGASQGRYLAAALPDLPLRNHSFDLALSSHFLFLYSSHLGLEFHRRALHEMLRVADEVRVFPLLQIGGTPSPFVELLMAEMCDDYEVARIGVGYEFQRGGNEMLRIERKEFGRKESQ